MELYKSTAQRTLRGWCCQTLMRGLTMRTAICLLQETSATVPYRSVLLAHPEGAMLPDADARVELRLLLVQQHARRVVHMRLRYRMQERYDGMLHHCLSLDAIVLFEVRLLLVQQCAWRAVHMRLHWRTAQMVSLIPRRVTCFAVKERS